MSLLENILSKLFPAPSRTGKGKTKGRHLRMESLENRELLSINAADFAALQTQYADYNLCSNIEYYNEYDATEAGLRQAISDARNTLHEDVVVFRTTSANDKITLNNQVNIWAADSAYGIGMKGITFVVLGDNSLTIDANNHRGFHINSVDVTFAGMTIANGRVSAASKVATTALASLTLTNTDGNGAGIYNYNGNLTIIDSTLKNNQCAGNYGSGAAIFSWGGSLTVIDSVIEGNKTATSATYGGGVYLLASTGTFIDTEVVQNYSYNGGGIYAGLGASLVISDQSTISFNSATGGIGGGVHVTDGTLTVSDSDISSNIAISHGGGISIAAKAGAVTIQDTTINANYASESSTTTDGGGIYYAASSTLTLERVDVSGNFAGNGGGIYASTTKNTVTIRESTINDNTSRSFGGGIVHNGADSSASYLTIIDCTLTGNNSLASTGGGAIYSKANLTILGVYDAERELWRDTVITDNVAVKGSGGGIYSTGVTVLEHVTLSRNKASNGTGGGMHTNDVTTVSYVTIDDNYAKTDGGGLRIGSTATISHSYIRGNEAGSDGGAIYGTATKASIDNCVIAGNYAVTYGGGIYGQFVSVNSATIVGNIAGKGGGGWYKSGTVVSTMNNSIVAHNVAQTSSVGGADIWTNNATQKLQVNYSLVYAPDSGTTKGYGSSNNLAYYTSPQFKAWSAPSNSWSQATWQNWNLELQDTSKAVNAGNSTAATQGYDVRGVGYDRVRGAAIDLGAYETGNTTQQLAAPTGAAATANENSVEITWNAVAGATSYVVFRVIDGKETFAGETFGTSYTDSNIASGTYFYRIAAKAANWQTSLDATTNTVDFEGGTETPTTTTPSPSGFQAGNDVIVTWAAIEGAIGYRIQRNDWNDFVTEPMTSDGKTVTFIDDDVPEGTYIYQVQAVFTDTESTWGDCSVMVSDIGPGTGVPRVDGTNPSLGTVTLSWGEIDGASHYKIYLLKLENTGYVVDRTLETDWTGLTWTQSGWEPGTYVFGVTSIIDGNESLYNPEAVSVKPPETGTLDTPVVTAAVQNNGTIQVSWGAVEGATEYAIERRVNGGSWFDVIAEFSGTSYVDQDVQEGNIEYRVQASSSAGRSEKGGASVYLDLPPATPSVDVESNDNGMVVLTWSAVDTAKSYEIRRREVGGEWIVLTERWVATTYTDTTAPEGIVEYAVLAYDGNLYSDYESHQATIDRGPAAPVVAATVIAEKTIQISWDFDPAVTHYSITRRVNGTDDSTLTDDIESNTFIDYDVPEGNVEYIVRAYSEMKASSVIPIAIYTDWAPEMPVVTDIDVAANGNVTITWDAVDTATSYEVRRRTPGGDWVTVTDNWTGTSYTDTTAPEGSVEYYVRAYEGTVGSVYEVHVATVSRPPAAPVVTLSVQQEAQTVTLTWDAVTGADNYEVRRRAAGGEWVTLATGMTGTEFIDTTAPEGNVEYSVRAYKGTQVSDFLGKSAFLDWAPAMPITVANVQESGNVVLTWSAVDTATHYEVRRRTVGGAWVTLTDHCNGTTFTDTTVTDGTYEYAVRAYEGTLASDFHTVEAVVERAPAAPVVTLTVLQSTVQVQVSWAAVSGASHYSVQRRTLGGEWETLAAGYGSTQFIDSEAPEGNVEYSVIAYKGTKESTPSTQGVFLDWPPAAPVVAAAAQPNGHVNLTWGAVPTATSYDIMRRTLSGDWVLLTDQWSDTEFVDRTAPEGTVQYAVIANEGMQSSGYTAVTVSVDYPPATPTFTATVDQNTKTVLVAWNAVTSATGYDVMRFVNNSWETIATNVTGNQFTDTTAPVGTVPYAVKAYKGVAVSGFNVVSAVINPEPGTPEFTATANNDGTVSIDWDAVAGAEEYVVFRSVAGADDWYDIHYSTGTSFVDSTVAPGTYDYTVIAYAGMYESDYVVQTVTVSAASYLTATANNDGTVSLNWSAIDTAIKYTIQRKTVGGAYETIATNITSLNFVDATVDSGEYVYLIRGIKGLSTVSTIESDVVTVAEPLPPFGAPTVAAAYNAETGTVDLTWNAVQDAVRYSVWIREVGGTWTSVSTTEVGTNYAIATELTGAIQVTVKAHSATAASGFVAVSVVVPDAFAPLQVLEPFGAPSVTAAYNSETGNVDLTWNAVEDAVRYSVWIRTVGGTWTVVTTNAGGTSYSIETALTGAVQVTVKAHTASVASGFVAVTLEIPDVLDEVFGDYDPDEELLGV